LHGIQNAPLSSLRRRALLGFDRTAVVAFTQLAIHLHTILLRTWLTQQGSPRYQLTPPAETPTPH
jgi:hypothetical protein